MKKIIINSDECGVYLGNCLGMGFWSKLDPVGQMEACVFENIEDAQNHIDSWDENSITDIQFLEVESNCGYYATIKQCIDAGADAWNPLDESDIDTETIH